MQSREVLVTILSRFLIPPDELHQVVNVAQTYNDTVVDMLHPFAMALMLVCRDFRDAFFACFADMKLFESRKGGRYYTFRRETANASWLNPTIIVPRCLLEMIIKSGNFLPKTIHIRAPYEMSNGLAGALGMDGNCQAPLDHAVFDMSIEAIKSNRACPTGAYISKWPLYLACNARIVELSCELPPLIRGQSRYVLPSPLHCQRVRCVKMEIFPEVWDCSDELILVPEAWIGLFKAILDSCQYIQKLEIKLSAPWPAAYSHHLTRASHVLETIKAIYDEVPIDEPMGVNITIDFWINFGRVVPSVYNKVVENPKFGENLVLKPCFGLPGTIEATKTIGHGARKLHVVVRRYTVEEDESSESSEQMDANQGDEGDDFISEESF